MISRATTSALPTHQRINLPSPMNDIHCCLPRLDCQHDEGIIGIHTLHQQMIQPCADVGRSTKRSATRCMLAATLIRATATSRLR